MNFIVLDTETTDLMKCFCYDCGWIILNDKGNVLQRRHFVIEQVWHNLPLFESAYYKDKRPLYVQLMRKHEAVMDKWGYVMRQLASDIRKYEVQDAYAYNSEFDDKVFTWNCDWFKTNNPLDTIAIHDIWGYACEFITSKLEYQAFCEKYERFTDTGNYKQSAEVVYQFITNNPEFIEQHMGVMDSDIESSILLHCVHVEGAKWATDYKVKKVLPRPQIKPFIIKVDNEVIYEGEYVKKYVRNDTYNFTTP